MKECPACKHRFPDQIDYCPQDGEVLEDDPSSLVGALLDGQYSIESLLGKGGMGAVYLGRHILLGDRVAIRIFPPEVRNNAEWLRRFRRESQAARRFRHPNAVTVYDLRTSADGSICMVMEYVEGHTLDAELKKRGRFSPSEALVILNPIMSVLNTAHERGLVHCDLKPASIMIGKSGGASSVKLLDLGTAKMIEIAGNETSGTAELTLAGQVLGTPFYMAPEQWSAKEPDARSDVYSLGIILYQMLSGDVPFKGTSIPSIMKKHLTLPPPSFKSVGVDVPPRVEAVVFHALEKEVNARTPTVEAFIAELRDAVASEPRLTGTRSSEVRGETLAITVPSWSPEEEEDSSALRLARELEEERVRLACEVREEKERLAQEEFWREDYTRREAAKESERGSKEVEELVNRDRAEREELEGQRSEHLAQVEPQAGEMEEPRAKSPLYLDDNAQFTVYKPKKIRPQDWYSLLAYAHLSEARADEDEADPTERMEAEVKRILGEQRAESYVPVSEESAQSIPRGGEITFTPFIPGVEFNPQSHSFYWFESVHGQEFRMRASAALEGKTARGRMSVFLGAIVLAEINLTLRVASAETVEPAEVPLVKEKPARPYRKVFPSYSHKDREIVAQIAHYAEVTGDKYLLDMYELRSGQNWKNWMYKAIEDADIFQLFWSTNSMRSQNVKLEWQHALLLQRENFIRPTYWENPLPKSPSDNLPPPELLDLHFYQIRSPLSMSVLVGSLPLGEQVEPVATAQYEFEQQGRDRIAREELGREAEERRRAAQEAERILREEEKRLAREQAEREREQREQIERVERHAREMEELSTTMMGTRVTIELEATQLQGGVNTGPLTRRGFPAGASFPYNSGRFGSAAPPPPKRSSISLIGVVFAIIGLIIGLIIVLFVIAK